MKVEALDQKVELRLHDTKPMWHQLLNAVLELKEGQQRLEQRFAGLEQRFEGLEQGHARLEQTQLQMQEDHQKLVQGQEVLRRDSHEMKTSLRDILRRLSIFNDTLVTIQTDYRDIYDRVRQLEINQQPSATEL
jgi:chromosome segregation ATPase